MENEIFLADLKNAENIDVKENIIVGKIQSLVNNKNYNDIYNLIINLKNIIPGITTARITKILKKTLVNLPVQHNEEILILLNNLIIWTEKENKKLLKLDLECKKVNALLISKKYKECLVEITKVLKELKQIDDKENQIRLYIYESKTFYELGDNTKAKSVLTSARALAVSSYCSNDLQAQIDLLSGMFICDDRLYNVAHSYFLESLEAFYIVKDFQMACVSFRYFLLAKIITGKYEDTNLTLRSKNMERFLEDSVIKIFFRIISACKNRDLKLYQQILNESTQLINSDSFIEKHLSYLYNILLEKNILKIIEPYSNLRIKLIASKLNFSCEEIENKIRKMILDRLINGTIDHVNGMLLLFDEVEEDNERVDNLDVLKEIVDTIN